MNILTKAYSSKLCNLEEALHGILPAFLPSKQPHSPSKLFLNQTLFIAKTNAHEKAIIAVTGIAICSFCAGKNGYYI
jgi:hypothetical protein